MPIETKTHIFNFVDTFSIKNKGKLYNMIKNHIEENPDDIKDPFTDDSATVRIHQGNQQECESCSS